jgi:hypothetical protein
MPRGPALRRSQFFRTTRPAISFTANAGSELPDELIEKGFELAYFLFPDHPTAINILSGALEKLEVQCHREKKRLFWRDKHPSQPVRRIIRKDSDILQWLILQEAEKYETEQEQVADPSKQDLIIRYIKHLVQITTAMSSFYVNIALGRLLHSYTTSEAQFAYEALTQRYLGADEYRRTKSSLMDRINKRFSKFLNVVRADHGELRFEPADDQQRWAQFVNQCLRVFTPWSTEGVCSKLLSINGNRHVSASELGHGETDQNEREMNACHILVEPACYARLIKELALDMPDTKLSLPKFSIRGKTETNDGDTDSNRFATLSPEVRNALRRRMAEKEQRRRKLHAGALNISVDGIHRADLVLEAGNHRSIQVELQEGANLIEIRAEDEYGSFPVATQLVPYADSGFESSNTAAILNSGKLELCISPIPSSADGPRRALLTVKYHPKFSSFRLPAIVPTLHNSLHSRWSFALTTAFMALIIWGLTATFYKHKIASLLRTNATPANVEGQQPAVQASAPAHYLLVPDDQKVRTQEAAAITTVSLHSHPQIVVLVIQLPLGDKSEVFRADLQTFSGDRTLMSQNFLRAKNLGKEQSVQIIVPTEVFFGDGYYTIVLYSSGPNGRSELINRFTFKVTSHE